MYLVYTRYFRVFISAQFRVYGADGILLGKHRTRRHRSAEADTVAIAACAAEAGKIIRVHTAKGEINDILNDYTHYKNCCVISLN